MTIELRDGCRAQRHALRAYVDGDATGIERLAFERHAEDCSACAEALTSAATLERELHRIDGAEPDAGFEQRVLAAVHRRLDAIEAVDEPRVRPLARANSARTPAIRWAAAALVVAAVAVALSRPAARIAPPSTPNHSATASVVGTREQVPATEDPVDPMRLAESKAAFARLLRDCARSPTPHDAFRTATDAMRKDGWPVETMLVAAIDDPNDDVARAAIRLAAESRRDLARPALLRADRRPALRLDVTRALGHVADGPIVALLGNRLADPGAWAAAIDALASSPRRDALAALEAAARDTAHLECAAEARLALSRRGPEGVRALLALAADGDGDAARVLGTTRCVDADLVVALLRAPRDVELARVAVEMLQDAVALPLLATHAGAFRDALGADGFAHAVDARLERCFELRDLVRTSLAAEPGTASAWIALLAARPRFGADALESMLADVTFDFSFRVDAAVALAALDRLDPRLALDAAIEALPFDVDAAATLLCCAVRAGSSDSDLPGLDPKRVRDSFRSARTAADRWRADGRPPETWERARIAEKLSNARL